MSSKTGTEILYKPDPDIDIKEFKQEPMDVSEMISCLSSETSSQSELRHISSETENEIVYKPVHDIDIEEFKHEPMDVSEMLSSRSSERNSLSEFFSFDRLDIISLTSMGSCLNSSISISGSGL